VPCSPVVAGAPAVMKTLTILTGCTPIRRSSWPVAAYPIPPSIAALRPPRLVDLVPLMGNYSGNGSAAHRVRHQLGYRSAVSSP
jgi:hypothetical protein